MKKGKATDAVPRFNIKLRELCEKQKLSRERDVIEDRIPISAYKHYEYEDQGALGKVMIRNPDRSDRQEDIRNLSDIVKTIEQVEWLHRIYVPDNDRAELIKNIWREVA